LKIAVSVEKKWEPKDKSRSVAVGASGEYTWDAGGDKAREGFKGQVGAGALLPGVSSRGSVGGEYHPDAPENQRSKITDKVEANAPFSSTSRQDDYNPGAPAGQGVTTKTEAVGKGLSGDKRTTTGGSLNLHPHLHTLAVDGVFEKTDGGGVRFHEAPAPSKDDVSEVAKRVRERAVRWLRRHGYVDERAAEERSNETPEPSAALDACTQLALAGGAFLARPFPRCAKKMRVLSTILDGRAWGNERIAGADAAHPQMVAQLGTRS
jgi:hypothetical protein